MEPTQRNEGTRVDTATVLFSDLVASTEHRVRLGEDGAEDQRTVHDALVRDAISSNRGVVVKHLGDGVMATFTSATSAVAGAVALQQAIDAANRRDRLDGVQIRIGISATLRPWWTPWATVPQCCSATTGGLRSRGTPPSGTPTRCEPSRD